MRAGDMPGLRVTPLAVAVEDREAVGEVRRDGSRGKLGPFGIGQRLTPLDAAAEEQLGNQHPPLRQQQAGIGRGRVWQLGAGGEQQQASERRYCPDSCQWLTTPETNSGKGPPG